MPFKRSIYRIKTVGSSPSVRSLIPRSSFIRENIGTYLAADISSTSDTRGSRYSRFHRALLFSVLRSIVPAFSTNSRHAIAVLTRARISVAKTARDAPRPIDSLAGIGHGPRPRRRTNTVSRLRRLIRLPGDHERRKAARAAGTRSVRGRRALNASITRRFFPRADSRRPSR